jgi:hypothetical protein
VYEPDPNFSFSACTYLRRLTASTMILHPSAVITTIAAAVAVLQQQHHGGMVDISRGDDADGLGIR